MNVRSLVTLPFRISGSALHLAGRVAEEALRLTGLSPDRAAQSPPPPTAPPRTPPADAPRPPRTPPADAPLPPRDVPAPPRDVPAQVPPPDTLPRTPINQRAADARPPEEPDELVAEVAERGAEDGAGAALQIDEPWENYDVLDAESVIARIGGADAAEVAIVELYERAHKQRRTVLAAAEQQLKELSRPERG